MPAPQKVYVQRQGAIGGEPKGTVRSTFDTLVSPDNRAVVTSIAAFGVRSPFLGYGQSSALAKKPTGRSCFPCQPPRRGFPPVRTFFNPRCKDPPN